MKQPLAWIILFIIKSAFISPRIFATTKNSEYHKIGVNTGLFNFGSIDELYSFASYHGKALSYGVKIWDGNSDRNHLLLLKYSYIKRHPSAINIDPVYFSKEDPNVLKNSFMFEAFDYYRYRIKRIESKHIKLYGEGIWQTTVNITTNATGLPELIQSGIGAGLFAVFDLQKHKFAIDLNTPLLSLSVRNCYSMSLTQNYEKLNKLVFVKQNAQIQFSNTLFCLNSSFEYEYVVTQQLSLSVEYNFRKMLNLSPRPLRSVTGIYVFNIYYKF